VQVKLFIFKGAFKGGYTSFLHIVMTWAFGNGLAILAVGIASLVMYSIHPTECGIGSQGNFTSNDGTIFTQMAGTKDYVFTRPDGTSGVGTYSGPGFPPLRTALLGTGIAYVIIGTVCALFGLLIWFGVTAIPAIFVLVFGAMFMFAWMIVLSVSLWRDGYDCININFPLWQMGMAATIISIVLVCTSGYGSNSDSRNF